MGATTVPHTTSNRAAATDSTAPGVAFLAAGAVDGVLLGLFTLVWILEPATAPSWKVVLATPLMALATITFSTLVRRRLPDGHRPAGLLASTARWWSLFALLLSVPAILIVASA